MDYKDIASQIQTIFDNASKGVEKVNSQISNLTETLKNLAENTNITSMKDFTSTLKDLVKVEEKYAAAAKQRAEMLNLAKEAQQALNTTQSLAVENGKKQVNTLETVYAKTKNHIAALKAQSQAMKEGQQEVAQKLVDMRSLLEQEQRLTQATKENQKELKAWAQTQQAQSTVFAATQGNVDDLAQKFQMLGGSIRELEAQNTALRNLTKGLNITENATELEKYNEIISANSFLIKANSDAATQQALNIGNYKSANEEAGVSVQTFTERLTELAQQYTNIQQEMGAMSQQARESGKSIDTEEYQKLEQNLHATAKAILEVKDQMEQTKHPIKEAEEATQSYRSKIRELTQQLAELRDKQLTQGSLSKEEQQQYRQLTAEIVRYNDALKDVKGQVAALTKETYSMDVAISGIKLGTSALQTYKAGIEMLGLSNKSYQKTMREFIALQSMVNGLTQISKQLQDSSTLSVWLNTKAMSANTVAKWAAVAAQKALNAVIKASPYVAAAAALVWLIKVVGEYIYKAKEMGQMTEENRQQFENIQAAMKQLSTDYMTTASKIENYRAALNSANITEEGEKRILSQLNKLLQDQKIHFEDIQEAKEWLNNDDFVMTLQREAIAMALFSGQAELVKQKVEEVAKSFEDMQKVTLGEKLMTGVEGISLNIEEIVNILNSVKSQGFSSFIKQIASLRDLATEEEKALYQGLLDYVAQVGKIPDEFTVANVRIFATMGTSMRTAREYAENMADILAKFAEWLPYEKERKSGRAFTPRFLQSMQESISKLYQIFQDETETAKQMYKQAVELGIGFDNAFDMQTFTNIFQQVEADFTSIQINITNTLKKNAEVYNGFIIKTQHFEEFLQDFSENSTLAMLKWKKKMQETALKEFEQKKILEKWQETYIKIKDLEKQYAEAKDKESANTIKKEIEEQKTLFKEYDKTLKELQKLQKEHADTINAINEQIYNDTIEWERKKYQWSENERKRQNNAELREFDEQQGLVTRLLGVYTKRRNDILTEQRGQELQMRKKEIETAITDNAILITRYQADWKNAQKAAQQETDQNRKNDLLHQAEIAKAAYDSLLKAKEDLAEDLKAVDDEIAEHANKKLQEYQQELEKAFKTIAKLADEFVSNMQTIFDNLDEAEKNQLEAELDRINTWKEARLKAIDETAMSDEERIAATSEAERVAAEKSYQIEVKKWQLEVQALRRQQVVEAAKATMSYAVAVMKAIEDYQALAAPIIAMYTATYATQLGTIMSQPVPEKPQPPTYAEGTRYHEGGLAIVGDGGKQEVVEAKGKTFLTPDTPTLVNLPKGARVYKDYSDYAKNRNFFANGGTSAIFDDTALIEAVKGSKAQMSVYFDKDGMFNVVARNTAKNRYITKTLKINR